MRIFVRKSIKKRGRAALTKHYKTSISDKVFNFIFQELGVNGRVFEVLENYFEFLYNHSKPYEKQFDSRIEDN